MTANKNKHIITNEIVSIREIIFLYVTFSSASEV